MCDTDASCREFVVPGPPLERYEGVEWNTRPAWMTKGLGVGTKILGEARGDLVKPGMTQSDFDKIESTKGLRVDGADPLGDFFFESVQVVPGDTDSVDREKSSPGDGEACSSSAGSVWRGWRKEARLLLLEAGGALPWSVLQDKLLDAHFSSVTHAGKGDREALATEALVRLPRKWLSQTENMVRLPHADRKTVRLSGGASRRVRVRSKVVVVAEVPTPETMLVRSCSRRALRPAGRRRRRLKRTS